MRSYSLSAAHPPTPEDAAMWPKKHSCGISPAWQPPIVKVLWPLSKKLPRDEHLHILTPSHSHNPSYRPRITFYAKHPLFISAQFKHFFSHVVHFCAGLEARALLGPRRSSSCSSSDWSIVCLVSQTILKAEAKPLSSDPIISGFFSYRGFSFGSFITH